MHREGSGDNARGRQIERKRRGERVGRGEGGQWMWQAAPTSGGLTCCSV